MNKISKPMVTCLSIDCPERKGGKCWLADGRTKQSRAVVKGWQDWLKKVDTYFKNY